MYYYSQNYTSYLLITFLPGLSMGNVIFFINHIFKESKNTQQTVIICKTKLHFNTYNWFPYLTTGSYALLMAEIL